MSLYFQVGLQTHGSAWVRDNANPRLAPEPPEGLGAVTGSEHKPSALSTTASCWSHLRQWTLGTWGDPLGAAACASLTSQCGKSGDVVFVSAFWARVWNQAEAEHEILQAWEGERTRDEQPWEWVSCHHSRGESVCPGGREQGAQCIAKR